MKADSEVIQNIKKMYDQAPTAKSYRERLDQLKKMGLPAIRVILDLAKTEDSTRTYFLFNLVSELGNTKAIYLLTQIAEQPNSENEHRLLAFMTIIRLGGTFDFESLFSSIDDLEMLVRFFVLSALYEADNPSFLTEFITQFQPLYEKDRFLLENELLKIKGDRRIVPLAGTLINQADDELLEILVLVLCNSASQEAYPYLQEIIQRTNNSRIEELTRKAIFELAQLKSTQKTAKLPFQFYKAFISGYDGSGSCIHVFVVKTVTHSIRILSYIANDTVGIKDAFGLEIESYEFSSFLKQLKQGIKFEISQVDVEYFFEKKLEAERLTLESGRKMSNEYLAWRNICNCRYKPDPAMRRIAEFNAFEQKVKEQIATLMPQTKQLYDYREFEASWYVDMDEMEVIVFSIPEVNDEYEDTFITFREVVQKHLDKIYPMVFHAEFLEKLRARLYQYSYICFLKGSEKKARLACAVSIGLANGIKQAWPFLDIMLAISLTILEKKLEGDFEDDDYDDEMDEFDEDSTLDLEEYYNSVDPEEDDDLIDGEQGEKGLILDPTFIPYVQAILENFDPLLLQNSSKMNNIDKLQFLHKEFSDDPFGKSFPGDVFELSDKDKVKLLNFWESNFDAYIHSMVGPINWEILRKEIDLDFGEQQVTGVLKEIQKLFFGKMFDRNCGSLEILHARRLWAEYVFLKDGAVSPLSKPASWAAGIDYLACSLYFQPVSQEQLAADYGISAASISARNRELKKILRIHVFQNKSQKLSKQLGRLLNIIFKTFFEEDL